MDDEREIAPPLLHLISSCEGLCVAACCGIDAFDFSPIHIASWLIRWSGEVDADNVAKIREQLDQLEERFGAKAVRTDSLVSPRLNKSFTPAEIDALVAEIRQNLEVALKLVAFGEEHRFKQA